MYTGGNPMFLKINENNVYYEIFGEGIPIITIHGFTVDHRLMKGFLEKIITEKNYKRIYFDLPGMGKTETNKQMYKAEEMYEVIKSVIRNLIGEEKYIIVGESYGGYLIRKLIKEEPEKIIGAMFLCPVVVANERERIIPEHEIIYNEIVDKIFLESEVYKNFISVAAFSNMEILKEFQQNIYSGIKIGNEEFLSKYYQNGYSFSEDIDDIEKPFRDPTLFVMGRQDHFVGYKDSLKILDNYSRATICVIDEAGHNVQIEKIKIIETLTLDWLERIDRNKNKNASTSPNRSVYASPLERLGVMFG